MNNTIVFNSSRIFLFFISMYLILGNLPRIIQIASLNDTLLLTEFILYVILSVYGVFTGYVFTSFLRLWPIIFIITVSFSYGSIINGFELKPLLYCIRLILILLSADIAGFILFKSYKLELAKVLNYVLKIYFVLLLISIIIYIAFPESDKFWSFLYRYGIVFNGDPHIHRLVSTYLDPNFYSAIACIPLLISLFLYRITHIKKYMLVGVLFIISILLSGSRSGLATMVFVLFITNYKEIILFFSKFKLKLGSSGPIIIILFLTAILSPLYIHNIQTTISRIGSISDDGSALARLLSFNFGKSILLQHPIFGVGYNYLSLYMVGYSTLSSVDSSLLSTLINFGIFFTTILTVWLVICTVVILVKFGNKNSTKNAQDFFIQYLLYIIFVVVFTSQFNNILYYQFWLFPVVMLGGYLSQVSKAKGVLHE